MTSDEFSESRRRLLLGAAGGVLHGRLPMRTQRGDQHPKIVCAHCSANVARCGWCAATKR